MTANRENSKASMPWFRMYHEFAVDPKVQMLSEADQRRYIMLLCLRCCNGDVTLHDETVAFQLRISIDEWQATKARLIEREMVGPDNQPTKWDKRQRLSDSSKSRVSRHRNKLKRACNVTVTAPDTDTDIDSEVEESPPSPLGGQADVKRTPVSDWKQAFARPEDSTGIEFSHGRVRLVNGARAEWLEKFGGDAAALDLALIEVGPQVQVNNRVPVRAQVDRHLATIVRRRLEQDDRYARAVASRQPKAEAPRKRSVLDIIREKPASEVVQ